MLAQPGGSSVGSNAYDIIDQLSTVQVNPNNTTTAIEQITFRSLTYGVIATFNVLQSVYQTNGAAVLVSERTAQLEQLVGHEHVQGARGEQDQDPSNGRLYNYLVLTIGTPDFARTSEIKIRMDQLGTQAAFAAIDAAWATLQALGPTGTLVA